MGSLIQEFIDRSFDSYVQGKDWVKKVVHGEIKLNESDPRYLTLRNLLNIEYRPHDVVHSLKRYLKYRKSLPIDVVTKEGQVIPVCRCFFKREVKRPLRPNDKLTLFDTPAADLVQALQCKYDNLEITFSFLKRNFRWLLNMSTLSNVIMDVWIKNLKSQTLDSEIFKTCLNYYTAARRISVFEKVCISTKLQLSNELALNFDTHHVVQLVIKSFGKRVPVGVNKTQGAFSKLAIEVKHVFEAEHACHRFKLFLTETHNFSSLKYLKIIHPIPNAKDRQCLIEFLGLSKSLRTVEFSLEHFTETELDQLIANLNRSNSLVSLRCDVSLIEQLSEDKKKKLQLKDSTVYEQVCEILKDLSTHDPEIAKLHEEIKDISRRTMFKKIDEIFLHFDKLVTSDLLEKSQDALENYRDFILHHPIFLQPFKIYFGAYTIDSSSAEPSIDRVTEKTVYTMEMPEISEPIIIDRRLAALYSLEWKNTSSAIYSKDDEKWIKRISEIAKTGKLYLFDLYHANTIHDEAINHFSYKVMDQVEAYIESETVNKTTLVDIYYHICEVLDLENKIFASIVCKDREYSINGVLVQISVDRSRKLAIKLKDLGKKIIRNLHQLIELDVLSELRIDVIDEPGWRKLKGLLVQYPEANIIIQLPVNYKNYDHRMIPQKHLDAIKVV